MRDEDGAPAAKRQRLSGAEKKKLAREKQKANKGANKNRRFNKVRDEHDMCWRVATGDQCPNGKEYATLVRVTAPSTNGFLFSCRFSHDMTAYLEAKPQDLFWSSHDWLISSTSPFVPLHEPRLSDISPSIDLLTSCPNFLATGQCKHGFKCRFLGGHVQVVQSDQMVDFATTSRTLKIVKNDELRDSKLSETTETNAVDPETLRLLGKRKVSNYICQLCIDA